VRAVVTDAEVTLADVLTMRLALDGPLAAGTALVLRHRGTGEERTVTLGASGVDDASFAVSLAPLGLTPGRWDAYLAEGDRRMRLRSVDPGFSLDHLDAYALVKRTVAYRAYRTLNGYLALRITQARPVAEVRALWLREGRFEVTGLIAYTGLDDDDCHHEARLSLHRHDPHARLTTRATVQGVRFHAALSLCDVIEAAEESGGTWEPSLEVEGVPTPLPLGARLDDVDGKRRRVHYPVAQIDGVPVRPSFSPDDELLLEVGG